ncbi:MAG: T9SS type A sorting domain-containing protein [Bacteroidetes bacterium]|nr:T9SS type A sorting domain-containing protein [Bacteroidota bacterium]
MKKIFIILFSVSCQLYAQTYRSGFDWYEFNGGAQGQGFSYDCNAERTLSNNEYAYIESYINMFRATKDKKYLEKFIIHVKRIQERRDDNVANVTITNPTDCQNPSSPLDNTSKAWSTDDDASECDGWLNRVLHSAVITYPMAEFVYFMQNDQDFMNLSGEIVPLETQGSYLGGTNIITFSDFANWLRGRINETLQYHDSNWCSFDVAYHHKRNDCSSGKDEINMQCAMGKTLSLMYLVESDAGNSSYASTYWNHISNIATTLHGNILQLNANDNTSYTWCHTYDCSCIEDIDHAYLVMEFANICYKYNIQDYYNVINPLFNLNDMQRFANTFAKHVYQAPLTFAQNTFGTNTDVCNSGTSIGHYIFLSQYNPYIYQQISDVVSEQAIYHTSSSLVALSELSMAQSHDILWNTPNNSNYKFNPIAVRRGHSPGSNVYYLASGDFDNNGMKDFVSMDFSNGTFYTYTPDICDNPNIFPDNCWVVANSAGHTPYEIWKGIAGGDFDYDGNPAHHQGDEVIALSNTFNKTPPGKIYLLKQNGTTFNEESVSSSVTWAGLTSGDFDPTNPGDEAIAVAANGDAYMIKYNGSIQQPVFISNLGISNAVGITSGNFDGTNIPQIAVVDNTPGNITIFKYQSGTFTQAYQYTGAGCCNSWNGITAGSFDGDGIDDIAVHRDADGQILIYKVKSGAITPVYGEYFPIFPPDQNQSIRAMGTGKYKLSTDKDALIVFRNYDGQITIFNMDGQCPNAYVNNTTVNDDYTINNTYTNTNNNYTVDYHANNTLYASSFKVGDISGSDNSKVTFTAGKKIVITPGANGSVAYSGSSFHAYIDPSIGCDDHTYFRKAQQHSSVPDAPIALNEPAKPKTTSTLNADISPNPNEGRFTLQLKEQSNAGASEAFIYNPLGQLIYQSSIINNQSTIDLSAQPRGIYFVKVQSAGKIYTEKVVVQ